MYIVQPNRNEYSDKTHTGRLCTGKPYHKYSTIPNRPPILPAIASRIKYSTLYFGNQMEIGSRLRHDSMLQSLSATRWSRLGAGGP